MIEKASSSRSFLQASRRWLPFIAAVALLAVAIVMLVAMLRPATSAQASGSQAGLLASSARWQALGNYYARQRALAADSARWQALGRSFTRLQRSVDASTARWQQLGNTYARASWPMSDYHAPGR